MGSVSGRIVKPETDFGVGLRGFVVSFGMMWVVEAQVSRMLVWMQEPVCEYLKQFGRGVGALTTKFGSV